MSGLQRFEQKLEQLISGAFARAFRSAVQPVEISAALQREIDNNTQILSRDRRLVPNDFSVELSDTDLERLSPYDNAMARDLADQLQDHADAQGYVFPGPVHIAFESAEDLTTGRFRIRSRAQASVTGDDHRTRHRTPQVQLEVNGTSHPLLPPGVVIGRGSESDIRISDPGISRRHVEFVVADRPGGALDVSVRDLGSTNGMLVDGRKIDRAPVTDGTVVRIGNTELVVRVVPDPTDRS
ncbi:FhaA domain-containing protein [Nocardioides campestrisoli]|uniref:FhaA domain-containing protein n=1 Tax=Nocardioides campestrisoli TaxID=2736757 RepID=UPI00163DA454|nr:DUF3662 and FHA domain-containing protein [Nocardioides campestrisoli]